MKPLPTDYPVESFRNQAAWRRWLKKHHADADGVWIRFARAKSGIPSVNYAEALDVALCFGWIDGQSRGADETTYLQKFTPRRPRSVWSKRNREHIERLTEAGLMEPSGIAAVDAAKADGRWERAYDSPATATVPHDLQAALDANPDAAVTWAALRATQRFSILYQVQTAVKPQTRVRRIAKYIDMLSRGEGPR